MKTCQGSLFEDMLRECHGCWFVCLCADAVCDTIYHHLGNKGEKRQTGGLV